MAPRALTASSRRATRSRRAPHHPPHPPLPVVQESERGQGLRIFTEDDAIAGAELFSAGTHQRLPMHDRRAASISVTEARALVFIGARDAVEPAGPTMVSLNTSVSPWSKQPWRRSSIARIRVSAGSPTDRLSSSLGRVALGLAGRKRDQPLGQVEVDSATATTLGVKPVRRTRPCTRATLVGLIGLRAYPRRFSSMPPIAIPDRTPCISCRGRSASKTMKTGHRLNGRSARAPSRRARCGSASNLASSFFSLRCRWLNAGCAMKSSTMRRNGTPCKRWRASP